MLRAAGSLAPRAPAIFLPGEGESEELVAECIGCKSEMKPTRAAAAGVVPRWDLCDGCRLKWSKDSSVGALSVPTPIESDVRFRLLLRVAAARGVDPFDAVFRACLGVSVADVLKGALRGRALTKTSPLAKALARADRAERRRRVEEGLPPLDFPGEAAKQRFVRYRLRKKQGKRP